MRKRASAELADSYTTFGEFLRYLRRRARLTQQQLGIAVGYSAPQISLLESGRRLPDLTTVAALFVPALGLEEAPDLARKLLQLASVSRQTDAASAPAHTIQRTIRRRMIVTDVIEADNERDDAARYRPPAPVVPLIGREQDLAAGLSRLLDPAVRLLTLIGPPGVGKTRLAQQIAWEARDVFLRGVCWVELAPVVNPGLVAGAIAQALGAQPANGEDEWQAVQRHLRDQHLLLALDNFEQVLDAAPAIAELLTCAPQLKVLITSREPLRLYGEHEHAVPPLALPDLAHLPAANDLLAYPSIALFAARARAIRPGFAVTSDNALAVAAICVQLDGLPLAIELAAAQAGLFSPQELAARLVEATHRLSVLRQRARNLPARHQTLAHAIDWSYRQLDSAEQKLFACLGVFAGPFDLSAVESICAYDPRSESGEDPAGHARSTATVLGSLIRKSLVQSVPAARAETRFALLETLREYAEALLEAVGELDQARRRHARDYLARAEAAWRQAREAERDAALEQFDHDHANMRAALQWLLRNDPDAALQLAGAIGPYWQTRGRYTEGRDLLGQALRHPGGAPSHRARALMATAALAHRQSDYASAMTLAEQGITLYRALGDRAGLGRALQTCAWIAYDMHDRAGAERMFQEGLAILREAGDQRSTATILTELAHIVHQPGINDEQVIHSLDDALTLLRALGWTEGIAHALFERGSLETRLGRGEAAHPYFLEALALYQQLGSAHLAAWAQASLGEVAWLRGDLAAAEAHYTLALSEFAASQDRSAILIVTHHLGQIARRLNDVARADQLYSQSLRMARELSNQHMVARCLAGLAGVALMESEARRAAGLLGAAFRLFEALPPFLAPADRAEYERFVCQARAALGDTFDAAWTEGAASVDTAA